MGNIRIEVADLREKPFVVVLDHALSFLELEDCDQFEFEGRITGSIEFKLVGEEVITRGRAYAIAKTACSRCLEPATIKCDANFRIVYIHAKEQLPSEPEMEMPNPAVRYYNGETVFPNNDIRESILLALPDIPVCEEGCKGLCVSCGVNLNKEKCACDKEKESRQNIPGWKKKLKSLSPEEE